MTEKLSDATRGPLLEPLFATGWEMVEGRDAITKTFKFSNFADAFGWMTRAAIWAEKWNHHPEWHNVYLASGAGTKGMLIGTGMAESVARAVSGLPQSIPMEQYNPGRFQASNQE